MERLSARTHAAGLARLDDLYDQVDVIEIDDALVRRSAALASRYALRGYDAVHCASAEQLTDPDLVAATGDQRLLSAWRSLGLSTFDTTAGADG